MPDFDFSRRIVLRDADAGPLTSESHVYRQDGDVRLSLDLYRPAATNTPPGVIFFVHGGPIPAGTMPPPATWGVFQSYGQLAASLGLMGVTFNHRLFAWTDYSTAERDVLTAVDYVRAHADAIGVDADRIGVWTFSGGGPLLASFVRERPAFVRCLVAFYAMLDVRHLVEPGRADRAEQAARFSAAAHLGDGTTLPPIFVARAGLDSPMVNGGVDAFANAALAANAPLTLVNHPHGQHAFDVLDDVPLSRDIIGRAMRFARQHLGAVDAS